MGRRKFLSHVNRPADSITHSCCLHGGSFCDEDARDGAALVHAEGQKADRRPRLMRVVGPAGLCWVRGDFLDWGPELSSYLYRTRLPRRYPHYRVPKRGTAHAPANFNHSPNHPGTRMRTAPGDQKHNQQQHQPDFAHRRHVYASAARLRRPRSRTRALQHDGHRSASWPLFSILSPLWGAPPWVFVPHSPPGGTSVVSCLKTRRMR